MSADVLSAAQFGNAAGMAEDNYKPLAGGAGKKKSGGGGVPKLPGLGGAGAAEAGAGAAEGVAAGAGAAEAGAGIAELAPLLLAL